MLFSGSQPGHTSASAIKQKQFRFPINSLSQSIKQNASSQQQISTLMNGNYQFCTEPPPSDWRSGAGVCFYFTKIGVRVSGYYGYPNTDDFVCLRGKVKRSLVTGEALMVSWLGREWTNIPKTAFKWDEEGHLLLKDGRKIRTKINKNGRTDWILFSSAKLDTQGFYRSTKSLLTSPTQLCDWQGNAKTHSREGKFQIQAVLNSGIQG